MRALTQPKHENAHMQALTQPKPENTHTSERTRARKRARRMHTHNHSKRKRTPEGQPLHTHRARSTSLSQTAPAVTAQARDEEPPVTCLFVHAVVQRAVVQRLLGGLFYQYQLNTGPNTDEKSPNSRIDYGKTDLLNSPITV